MTTTELEQVSAASISRYSQALARRERVARELKAMFDDRGLKVTCVPARNQAPLDMWGWQAVAEDLIELIDRGKVG